MKKSFLSFCIFFLVINISIGQNQGICGSYKGYLEDDKKKYPEFYNSLHEKEINLQKEYTKILHSLENNNLISNPTQTPIKAKSSLDIVFTGSCTSPSNFSPPNFISPTEVLLNWDPLSSAFGYRFRYRVEAEMTNSSSAWNTHTLTGNNNFIKLIDLSPGKVYEWQVRSMCDSLWQWRVSTDSMAIDPINNYITYYSEDTSGAFVLTGYYQIVVDTLSSGNIDTLIVAFMDTIGVTSFPDTLSLYSNLENPTNINFFGIDVSEWASSQSFKMGKRVIPVVVHIIHDLGQENVSDEEVHMAIETLNKNINGQGDNFEARTPPVFGALRGVANVEFKLAQIDPEGNSTTGILRVQSPLTFEPVPGNRVKTLSYWNSYEYYNIWVLRKFVPQDDGNTLLGYAQFPGGNMLTDGVVLIYSEFNDPTSATLTHETGHWLGLCHPWDCGSGTCGDDNIFDTPPARQANFGVSFNNFPYHVGLQNQGCIADSMNWAGEMFMNYMDYTPDQYTTMFSREQVDVMHEILDGAELGDVGYREYLWDEDNLQNAGLVNSISSNDLTWCQRQIDFTENTGKFSVCEGEQTWLKANKSVFGSTIDSCSWTLGGNVTISAGDLNDPGFLLFEYDDAGSYDISIYIEYNEQLIRRASSPDAFTQGAPETFPDSIVEEVKQEIVQSFNLDELITMGATITDTFSIDSLGKYWNLDGSIYYRGVRNVTTYVAYYNSANYVPDSTCKSYMPKSDFIIVHPESLADTLESEIYPFDDAAHFSQYDGDINVIEITDWTGHSNSDMSPEDVYWSITGEGGDLIDPHSNRWEWISWTDSESGVTQSSLMMEGRNNFSLGTDDLISKAYNISALDTPAIRFNWAGAHFDEFPVNELNIYYSTDCGEIWRSLVSIPPAQVASNGYTPNTFFPSLLDWSDTVIVKNVLKNDNIRFKFEYITNNYNTNRLYIDNIEIGEKGSLLATNQNQDVLARLFTYPNPYDPNFGVNVKLDNLKDQKVKVQLINILGKEIGLLYSGTVSSNSYVIDKINLNEFPRGVYFITVITDNKTILTDKLILNK